MMSPQQQQILTRSALAAGVALAVGLAAIGFVTGRAAGPVAPAASEASAGVLGTGALPDAGRAAAPDGTLVATAGRPALDTGTPRESSREVVYEDGEYEHESHEDEEHDNDEHEREGSWKFLSRAFSRERR